MTRVFYNNEIFLFLPFLAEDAKGINKIWILGDNFLAETYRQHVRKGGEEFYMRQNFEVWPFCSSRFSDCNPNMLSRITNSMISALNNKVYLPVYLIIVLEDDLITFLDYCKFGVSGLFGMWLEYIAANIVQFLDTRCQQLPVSAIPRELTQIYWVEPINHNNFSTENRQMREKMCLCVESVTQLYDNMRALKIRHP